MIEIVKFTSFQLVIGGETPSLDTMENVTIKAPKEYAKQGEHYRINQRVDRVRGFYWLYAEYGKPLPLPDNLYNVENHIVTKNLRTPN
ncbi:MAG: hypothetical protein PHO32_02410 [Candidatus Cloacimonetes bacterium]|nr:hypothetical protein [Candidatus Cloacimonadota bacterium]